MNTKSMNIDIYMKELASKAPIPGGGGVSAISCALAISLMSMVGNLTLGKKKYEYAEENIQNIIKKMEEKIDRFLFLADEDARVFEPLSKAYSIEAKTEEEKVKKDSLMEELLLDAARIPLTVMREIYEVLDDLEFLADNGSRLALSDVGVAAGLIESSLKSAILNVKINTKFMKNKKQALELDNEAYALLCNGVKKSEKIYDRVLGEL